jgi:hypothetical protein
MKRKSRVKAGFSVSQDQTINARLIYPTLLALEESQTYALVEGTAMSIPMYQHIRSNSYSA